MDDNFEKLNKSNYLQWSIRMRGLLEANDCLDSIKFNTNLLSDEQRIEDEKCKSLLYLSVDKDSLDVIEECTTSTEIWNKLKEIHTKFHGYRAILLLKEFVHLEMDQNENILEYVNRRDDLYKKVQDAGFNFEWKVLMGLMLIGLSMEYEYLRKTIKIDDDSLTPASLEMRLAKEEKRLKDMDTTSHGLPNMEIDTNLNETPCNSNGDQIKTEVAEIEFEFADLHHSVDIKEETLILENEEDRKCTVEGGGKHFICEICGHKFTRKGNLTAHLKVHAGEKSFTCEVCDRKFPRKREFRNHLLTHSREKTFSCQICDHKCALKSQLKKHVKTHTGETLFICEICNFKGTNKRRFEVHLKIHAGVKPFLCEFCAYNGMRKEDFKKHLRIHTGEKPYSCEICDYKCAQKGTMTMHLKIHRGEKRHSCQFCDYKCREKYCLTRHLRTHTGERPFACGFCDFKSAQKSDLKAHLKLHTGEKPLTCETCQYKCVQLSNLKRHLKTHSGEKPFGCAICDYRCIQKSGLKKHLKSHTR